MTNEQRMEESSYSEREGLNELDEVEVVESGGLPTVSPYMSLIYQQIPKVMREIGVIAKTQENVQQGFMFRGIDDIYNNIKKILAEHEVFTIPLSVDVLSESVVETRSGATGYRSKHLHTYRLFASDGSYIDAQAIGESIDYGDKGSNKCAATAHKYLFIQLFCIPTIDLEDPDSQAHDLASASAPKGQDPRRHPPKPAPERFDYKKPGQYEITFGKHKGKRLEQVERSYIDYMLKQFRETVADEGKSDIARASAKTRGMMFAAELASRDGKLDEYLARLDG